MGAPLVLIHGFMDTGRTWDLVRPALERRHDVITPTLPGHAGGTPLSGPVTDTLMADAIEQAMDDAGFATAHIAGNSLGGHVALQMAERGRAESVTALAPGGGWAEGDDSRVRLLESQRDLHRMVKAAAPRADALLATRKGRRRATELIAVNYEHIPTEMLVHFMLGVAQADAEPMLDHALHADWTLDAERITCPVRIVWGTEDRLLPWPSAAARYRNDWLPHADWVVLDDVGHCPQLDVPLATAELIPV